MTTPAARTSARASTPGGPASDDIARAKDEVRARVLAARLSHPLTDADAAARVARALALSEGHARVALYVAVDPEPATRELIDLLFERGVRVLLPVLKARRTPSWAWYAGPDSLRPGWRHIPEPTGSVLGPEALADVRLVWCSALTVTRTGHRLGTGGGWYDRALQHRTAGATLAALVNDREVVDALPTHPWDRPVDVVVTERRTLWTGE